MTVPTLSRRHAAGAPSARGLLLTLLGEFVLTGDGTAWTSAVLATFGRLGIEEKTTRQALMRTAAAGWLDADKQGRRTRWRLTGAARQMLTDGAARIYSFTGPDPDWDGRWLLISARIPESDRRARHVVRTRLNWAGFGSLGPGLWISPHPDREAEAVRVLREAGLTHTRSVGTHRYVSLRHAEAWPICRALIERAAAKRKTRLDVQIEADSFRVLTSIVEAGLGFTLLYTIGTIFLGTLIGLIVGVLRLGRIPVIDWLLVAYIELFRCTPLLVQIIWFYYAFPVLLGVNIPAHVAAVSVLSLYGGAFYAEIVRGSIESVPRGQWDAARALGLGYIRMLRFVIIPQALKPMMAPYVNQSVTQLKNTSLVSVIAVPDLVYNATLINADTYRPLEVYTVVALIYFAILFPATLIARRLERGMTYDKA